MAALGLFISLPKLRSEDTSCGDPCLCPRPNLAQGHVLVPIPLELSVDLGQVLLQASGRVVANGTMPAPGPGILVARRASLVVSSPQLFTRPLISLKAVVVVCRKRSSDEHKT